MSFFMRHGDNPGIWAIKMLFAVFMLIVIIPLLYYNVSYIDNATHMFKDSSKTETTELACETLYLFTNENHNIFNTWTEFYVLAESGAENAYIFKVKDEMEWKLLSVGNPITIQVVQEYSKSGKPYAPYYTCNGEEISGFEVADINKYSALIEQKSEEGEGEVS